jgi:hypothetical protein
MPTEGIVESCAKAGLSQTKSAPSITAVDARRPVISIRDILISILPQGSLRDSPLAPPVGGSTIWSAQSVEARNAPAP